MNGADLLTEFRATRAEKAFSEVVRRHTDFVYSIAKRRVLDITLAQETTQIVFIRLAKTPPKVGSEGQLLAWLHRTTVHVSIDLWRSETRRRAREQKAVAMQTDRTEEVAWNDLKPILDEALDELNEADREVIFLRFFEQKTMADLGRSFGVSEDAAKMRVSRALEKLRAQLGNLGATCSAMLLGTLLFERSVEAAPKALVLLLASIRVLVPTSLAASIASLLLQAPKVKLLSGLVAAVLLGGTALFLVQEARRSPDPGTWRGTLARLKHSGTPNDKTPLVPNSETNNTTGELKDPDPIKLLQGVTRARQRIASGIIDFDVLAYGNVTHPDATNRLKLKIQFEDGHLWAEEIGEEYSYVTPIPGGPEAEAIIKRADSMPHAQAAQEGLIKPFPSHHITFYDGELCMDYRETEGQTDIDKPGHSGVFIFDPRCLGISTTLYVESTLDKCIDYYKGAKSVTLVGQDFVDGHNAWHLRVRSKYDYISELWIDTLHSDRVLKLEEDLPGDDRLTLSYYSSFNPKDALPIEVRNISYRNGVRRYETRLVRLSTQYVPIDPACWTMAGLHMKVGTRVVDRRNHRRLGLWTGTGFTDDYEHLPPKDQPLQDAPNRAELLALLENDPASPTGFGAALWIMTNSPDGPDLQKAADTILQSHIQKPEMGELVKDLERMRPLCTSNLLQSILDQNPDINVRAKACMTLAKLQNEVAGYGTNKSATARAEKLYERMTSEFGQLPGERGYTWLELAQPELDELRKLTIGKVAPEIVGNDLYDHPMKLSDYRGRIVTLLFWTAFSSGAQEARGFRQLVEQMKGKPFVLLGVPSCDSNEQAKSATEEWQINWSSFQEPRIGPITKTYNVKSWPAVFVLDRKGVIRYRGLWYPGAIAGEVDKLLKE